MRFTCAKTELLQAVGIANRAAAKMQKSILECIYFSCEGEIVTLRATDIALSIETTMGAQIEEPGSAAIPAKVLYEIINRFPDSDVCFASVGENTMEISCLNSKVDLQLMNADEFPVFPALVDSQQIKLPQNILKKMVQQTIFAVAVTEEKPILTGLLFDMEKDSLTMVGIDGYRMAVRKQMVISDMECSCVIPSRTLREVSRIIDDTEENVKISVSGNMALFEIEKTNIYTRLLEGEFIRYRNLLPKDYSTSIKVETDMLLGSIERASILAREGSNNVIRFELQEKVLSITSNSEMGKIDEKVPMEMDGKDLKIAFNAKYILDVLKNVDDQEVNMLFNTEISPCVVKKEGEGAYEYLILPVQTRD